MWYIRKVAMETGTVEVGDSTVAMKQSQGTAPGFYLCPLLIIPNPWLTQIWPTGEILSVRDPQPIGDV